MNDARIVPFPPSKIPEGPILRPMIAGLLLILSACASRKPVEKPTITSVPAALIPDKGASLYLIEAFDDWLDDGCDIGLTIETPKNTILIGEQALTLVLRSALSQKSVEFKAQGDFLITSGRPTEVTLADPEGLEKSPYVGFHMKLEASHGRSAEYVNLKWSAQALMTDARGNEIVEPIAEGSGEYPYRATLLMRRHKTKDRSHFLLLRIASLAE